MTPAPEAGKRTLIRRLSFDLTGLPPEPEDVEAFLNDRDSRRPTKDSSTGSWPARIYGERWARHWLDLVRYAETAGHEFDYEIPNAFRYRDYLIRAFNLDVPYDQLVVEHISGDALEDPRRHPVEGYNESTIGDRVFSSLGEGTHSPVDIREEQMRRIDNQTRRLLENVPGAHAGLCPLSRSQIRPDHHQGLLRPGGISGQLAAPAGFHRFTRSDRQIRERPWRLQGTSRGDPGRRTRSTAGTTARARPPSSDSARSATRANSHLNSEQPGGPADRERVFEDFDRDHYDGWFVTGDAFGDRPTLRGRLSIRPR